MFCIGGKLAYCRIEAGNSIQIYNEENNVCKVI